MKRHILIALGAAGLLTLASCGEDFLYKAPQGSIDQAALTNEQGTELLVINAYAYLTAYEGYENMFNWVFGGLYGGDCNKGSDVNDQSVLNSVETYSISPSNDYLLVKWRETYRGVKRCNLAITVLNEAEDVDATTKAIRIGEMKFLRTLHYFEGVKMFSSKGVPYIDEVMAAEENDPKVHNGVDIYPQLLADIDDAINALPETQPEVGRANKTAAKALKAKMLMQQGDLASAKPILKDIIENGLSPKGERLALQDDLNNNFNALTENGKESIFEVQFSVGANNNGNAGMCLNYPHNSGPGGCCGFDQPSNELANSFQVDANGLPYLNFEYRQHPEKPVSIRQDTDDALSVLDNSIAVDPRLDFTMGRFGVPYKDWGLPRKDWVRDVNNGGIYMPKKHVYTKEMQDNGLAGSSYTDGWAPGSAMNLQYLSLRDCKLLYAECLANDGELAAAMAQVNDIRRRAGLDVNIIKLEDGTPAANYKVSEYPASHAAFSDKETCIKAVRMERKLELAMEGQRFFDLARWGGDYMNKELNAFLAYERNFLNKYNGVSAPPASKTMYPIPETQIQTMGNDENGQPYLVQPDPWK